jgi:RNA polymerase sigma-70 factor (ECF subfamily)
MVDNSIINKMMDGDQLAFREFVDHHSQLVFNTCLGFLHNQADAEDVSQEVFIKVYNSLKSFRMESKISTWLYRIAINQSINYIRNNRKQKFAKSIENFFSNSKDEIFEISDTNAQTDSYVENKERAANMQKALNSLPENQKIAFTLSKFNDKSYNEISEIMNISIPSVESLIYRARKKTAKEIAKMLC